MYPEILIVPMREELTRAGAKELRTAAEVDAALAQKDGTALVVVNSVCGCAAGKMRPGVRMALQNAARPDRVYTVFAGQDREATDRARQLFGGVSAFVPQPGAFRMTDNWCISCLAVKSRAAPPKTLRSVSSMRLFSIAASRFATQARRPESGARHARQGYV